MSRPRMRGWIAPLALAAVAWAFTAEPLLGQYFGRNKVQYETFDFRVLQSENFDIYFYPEMEDAARDAGRMAERWYERLSTIFNHEFDARQPVIFYATHPHFQQTTTLSGDIGEGTGGVTEAFQQRVIMPLAGSHKETDHVLGHELVHAFQYDISGLGRFRGGLTAGARAFAGAPLWFTEGMAEYLSLGPVDPHTAMWLRDAVLTGDVPTIQQLTQGRYFPYRWGHAFWAYVGGRWGDATIGQILQIVGQGVPYQQAFQRILNIELTELSEDWHVAIRRAYLPMLAERPEAREIARPLITRTRDGGRVNIGPSISPDGRRVAFLSERELDIDLWLADAQTGEVIRRLRRGTAFDPHFQSLRFLNSAGTWSPDGTQFAFSAQRGARDVLVFLNAESGAILREVDVPGVGEITNPSWSPDGRSIAFAGISGGLSDLYVHELETRQTRRLTQDRYAVFHPSFSPDGRTIAFVTERGPDTDLARLEFGPYRIALIDAAGGDVRIAPNMQGDNMNPVWTRDGEGVFFISNRSGIPNIYRINLETGELARLTRLFTGVSGYTNTSPAITAARDMDRLLFTVYENNGYNIYSLNTATELAGSPVVEPYGEAEYVSAALLPPVPRAPEAAFNRVANLLANPDLGLPAVGEDRMWEEVPYRPRLGLDYLGQPQVGYTTGGVMGQGGLYGGVSGIFSDVLGYHTVYGTVLAQGELDETGFAAMYINQKFRWNWGAAAQRIPYVTAGQRFFFDGDPGPDLDPAPGDNNIGLLRNQILRQRYFNTALSGITQYPFSQVQRLELGAGVRRISRDVVVTEVRAPAAVQGGAISIIGPAEQARFRMEQFGIAYNFAEVSAALVYDNSLFGWTSPFAGQRYRFEVTPTAGTLNFIQALADYRRYQFLQPFTLAVQGLHFGRYGQEDAPGEQTLFYPIFLGQPSLVRGYWDVYSQCYNNPGACDVPVLENLFGTRVAVAKAELRFPLVRALVLGPGIGFPPIEGFGFFDAGMAWNSFTSPAFQRGPQAGDQRGILSSAGVGGRVNLLGYAVLEVNYVRPLDYTRADGRSWHWQIALQPGF
jgi:Tol biopolymer transport system component